MTFKIPKPKRKMKTLVRYMEQCIFTSDCVGCPYDDGTYMTERCRSQMLIDSFYYLRQTVEKSEKGKS